MTLPPASVPLTVVIPTWNEADQIAQCIASVRWAAEVIVADAGSSDGTVEAARRAGARVLEKTGPTIAAQRNAAIAAGSHPWVFALDADERVSEELARELSDLVGAPRHAAYRVRRRNWYLGAEVTRGRWGRDWVVRCFPRERRYTERRVHEALEPVADLGSLHATLTHDPYRSLAHQSEKMHRYAEWAAKDLFEQGRRAGWRDLALRPAARFFGAYLMEGAWRDGGRGLVRAGMGGCAVFLRYAHLWQLGSAASRAPSGR